jgi:hypothetical protein
MVCVLCQTPIQILISLSDISGRLFDADGKVLKSIRKKDISDMSTSDDETILTDTRVKRYFLQQNISIHSRV